MSSNGRADQQLLPGVTGLRQPAARSHPSIPRCVVSIRLVELRATIRGKCPCQMPWRAIMCLSFLSALPLPDIESITFWGGRCKARQDYGTGHSKSHLSEQQPPFPSLLLLSFLKGAAHLLENSTIITAKFRKFLTHFVKFTTSLILIAK